MFKRQKIAIYAALILSTATAYLVFGSDSSAERATGEDLVEIDFASLSQEDIDIIAAVKENMKTAIASAKVAE